jgi:hypothetical protein
MLSGQTDGGQPAIREQRQLATASRRYGVEASELRYREHMVSYSIESLPTLLDPKDQR